MAHPKKKSSKKADEADSDSQEKKRALFQKATGLLGYHPYDEDREREAYRQMKEQLTEEELEFVYLDRSTDW